MSNPTGYIPPEYNIIEAPMTDDPRLNAMAELIRARIKAKWHPKSIARVVLDAADKDADADLLASCRELLHYAQAGVVDDDLVERAASAINAAVVRGIKS